MLVEEIWRLDGVESMIGKLLEVPMLYSLRLSVAKFPIPGLRVILLLAIVSRCVRQYLNPKSKST